MLFLLLQVLCIFEKKMNESLIYRTDALVLVLLLFATMLLAVIAGQKLGIARLRRQNVQEDNSGNATVVASLFGLLGFLLAFTFGMSAGRYDNRQQDITREANAIGTAMLRSDLYPDSVQQLFRLDIKAYAKARILYYEAGRDGHKIAQANQQADFLLSNTCGNVPPTWPGTRITSFPPTR